MFISTFWELLCAIDWKQRSYLFFNWLTPQMKQVFIFAFVTFSLRFNPQVLDFKQAMLHESCLSKLLF